MNVREVIAKFLRSRGYALIRDPQKKFFEMHRFDVVLDVGANTGQYGIEVRKECQYKNRIVSFEPMSAAYAQLAKNAARDKGWTTVPCGLGNIDEKQQINIAGNSASSSLYDMLPAHSDIAPVSAYVSSETVQIRKLDAIFDQYCQPGEKVLLKIDTQGYEVEVLKGATESLKHVSALQLELSLSPLYAGAPLMEDVMFLVREQGFVPYWFLHGFKNPQTLQLMQMDGLFIRPGDRDSKKHS